MRICNRVAIVIFLSFVAIVTVGAQDESDVPVKPSVSKPAKPSVSKPTLGGSFYMPKRSDFYTGSQPVQTQSAQKTEQTSDSESTQSEATKTTTSAQNLNSSAVSSIATAGAQSLNMLTADDISSLNNLGIFSQISGLLGRGNTNLQSQLLANQNTVTANTIDSATLQQILSELTELKNQMGADSSSKGTGNSISLRDKSIGQDGFSNKSKKEAKILRFIVNGYDILQTCTKVYFSDIETDGTFLLTGDRKYLSENRVRTETFYFYFHANGIDGGITKYAVTPAVSQDYENQYSYLYQLTQKNALTAERTGNLVTLRVSEANWKLDLLLSLDS